MRRHPFNLSEIKDLAKAIQDPIAVFHNPNNDGHVILTELKQDGVNHIAVIKIRTDRKANNIEIENNNIVTVFPKDKIEDVAKWIKDEKGLGSKAYFNKEKSLAWLSDNETQLRLKGFDTKDLAKIIKDFQNPISDTDVKNVRFQVDAWHGSPHDIQDGFRTDKIGTGEGEQRFGWGLYFTDLKDIAEDYAKSVRVYIGGKTTMELYDETKNPVWNWVKTYAYDGLNKKQIIAKLKDTLSDKNWIERFIWAKHGVNNVLFAIDKNGLEIKSEANLYRVTLHKGKTPDEYTWLEWDKPVPKNLIDKIKKQIKKEGLEKSVFSSGERIIDSLQNVSGQVLYNNLKYLTQNTAEDYIKGKYNVLSDKDVSLFLLRAGIDGIKYPAESISRGTTSDNTRGFNYVVFDENAITIEDHTRFQQGTQPTFNPISKRQFNQLARGLTRAFKKVGKNTKVHVGAKKMADRLNQLSKRGYNTPQMQAVQFLQTKDGTIYGFVDPVTGDIYMDGDLMNANTPIHEFGHLWISNVQQTNPKLWERMVNVAKETPEWKRLANDPNYKQGQFKGKKGKALDNAIADEVWATIIGNHGENNFEAILEKMNGDRTLAQKVWDAVQDFWQSVVDFFHDAGVFSGEVTLPNGVRLQISDEISQVEKAIKEAQTRKNSGKWIYESSTLSEIIESDTSIPQNIKNWAKNIVEQGDNEINAFLSEVEKVRNSISQEVTAIADMALGQIMSGEFGVADPIVNLAMHYASESELLRDANGNVIGVKPEVLEEIRKEREQIEQEARANGTWMKAPNGKKSNLTEEQWVTVRTKRFKDWFGDWEVEAEQKAIQEKIEKLLNGDNDTSKGVQRETIGKITPEQAKILKEKLGIDPTGFKHTLDKSEIVHTLNEHGEVKAESNRGQIAVTENDFLRLPEILNNPDKIEYSGKNKKGLETIKYTKAFNGTTYVVEEVRNGRKELALNTMYKRKTKSVGEQLQNTTALTSETLPQNKGTNSSEVSKVVDENGEPKPVFHKTNAKRAFNVFNTQNSPSWFTPVKGSTKADGTESIRNYKNLGNGYIVVVEQEGRFDVGEMEAITMWAERTDNKKSHPTNVSDARNNRP
ncbi:MAG: hypothetical protein WDA08_01805 [Weeksellaceae bacterium]